MGRVFRASLRRGRLGGRQYADDKIVIRNGAPALSLPSRWTFCDAASSPPSLQKPSLPRRRQLFRRFQGNVPPVGDKAVPEYGLRGARDQRGQAQSAPRWGRGRSILYYRGRRRVNTKKKPTEPETNSTEKDRKNEKGNVDCQARTAFSFIFQGGAARKNKRNTRQGGR